MSYAEDMGYDAYDPEPEDYETWTMKNGREIEVTDMETSHIINTIAMLKRRLSERPTSYPYMGDSDFASDSVDREEAVNEQIAEEIEAWIDVFEKELKTRKR